MATITKDTKTKAPAAASPRRKTKASTAKKPARSAGAAAKQPAGVARLGRTLAWKTFKLAARKALEVGREAAGEAAERSAAAARDAAERTAAAARTALEHGVGRRLPIQASVDVAVPLEVAWEQWMTLESLTEGIHRIDDVERDGTRLFGRTAAPASHDWEAEIVDERECEALAWRSLEGSDCAGLVTFHRLSDRLTRVELDVDAVPTGPGEALALSLHLGRRRAEADLRRFKARAEFINPDTYEAARNGGESGGSEKPGGPDGRENNGRENNDGDTD